MRLARVIFAALILICRGARFIFAAPAARTSGTPGRRRVPVEQRLAREARRLADSAGHLADVVGAIERRPFSGGVERWLQSAVTERAGYQGWPRGWPHAGDRMPGSGWRFRRTAARCGWAVDRKLRFTNFRSMRTASSLPRAHLKSSKAQRDPPATSSAMSPSIPEGHLLYACDLYHDAIVVVNAQSGIVIDRFKTGRRPYRILFNPDGKSFYVTSWADGSLYRHQTVNGALLQTLRLGAHPTDMIWRDRAYTRGRRRRERPDSPDSRRAFLSRPRIRTTFMPLEFPIAAICAWWKPSTSPPPRIIRWA